MKFEALEKQVRENNLSIKELSSGIADSGNTAELAKLKSDIDSIQRSIKSLSSKLGS